MQGASAPLTGMAGRLARRSFQGRTYRQQSTVALVLTTPRQVLQNNPDRVAWMIINRGNQAAVIDFLQNMNLSLGTFLQSYGGWAAMNYQEDGEACGDEVWGAGPSAATTVQVYEIIAFPEKE